MTSRRSLEIEGLLDDLARFHYDPLGFVKWAFPWGEPNTPLEERTGPEEWQADQLERIGRRLREGGANGAVIEEDVSSGHGVGKAHDVNTVLYTPTGRRRWGDLGPADTVFGADGAPTTITQTHHYHDVQFYRVSFDDGSFTDVTAGHLWNVRDGTGTGAPGTPDEWQLLSVGELQPLVSGHRWEIPLQGPAQFDPQASPRALPAHPYVMGAWLGDGGQPSPTVDRPYPGVAARIRQLTGLEVNSFGDYAPLCGSHPLDGIPEACKCSTGACRRQLFEGLCDSAVVSHGCGILSFSTPGLRLAEDVVWLARSLGARATLYSAARKIWVADAGAGAGYPATMDCWHVTLEVPFNPFMADGPHRSTYEPVSPDRLRRWIRSITALPYRSSAMCISVDAPDGLYQANDFLVTHNSAQVSWLVLWALATHVDTRGVVTANTDLQLRTKTWAELGKWYQMFIARALFTFTATAVFIANDKVREKTWRVDAVPWSENNTEAFAGLHNQGKRIIVLFDESSTIADAVWETTEGALTDARTQVIWCRYGNPTRTSGRFFSNCSAPKRNTYTRVDSRHVSFSNPVQIQAWVDDYGEDSDFVRVRVKGQFPRAGRANFISPELVFQARRRRPLPATYVAYPKILAVDPARFGDDSSVITLRQGLKVHFQLKLSGFDGFELANRVAEIIRKEGGVSCVAFDAIGNGAELDGTLRRIPGLATQLIPVMWGQPAKDDTQYYNQRSECWGKMREWLENGEIPDDDALAEELTSLDYGYDGRFRIQLQSKKDMKRNGGKSPDCADSLALSFVPDVIDRKAPAIVKAKPVRRRTIVWSRNS